MNGVKYLLDTNIIIGLTEQKSEVLTLLTNRQIKITECAYSAITRMELLSFAKLTLNDKQVIEQLLNRMRYLPLTKEIENKTIEFRQQYPSKLPDSIIAATSLYHKLSLITLDTGLANKCP